MTIKAVVFDAYGTLYDVQSVADVTEEAFPGYGEIITQIWRIKQLEYSWLRTLMRRYQDFSVVTRDALAYTLRCLGLQYDDETFAAVIDKYRHLDLYPDARIALVGVGATPVRAVRAERLLRGAAPSDGLWEGAEEAVRAEVEPDGDIHASAEYRRHVAGVLTRRALAEAASRVRAA